MGSVVLSLLYAHYTIDNKKPSINGTLRYTARVVVWVVCLRSGHIEDYSLIGASPFENLDPPPSRSLNWISYTKLYNTRSYSHYKLYTKFKFSPHSYRSKISNLIDYKEKYVLGKQFGYTKYVCKAVGRNLDW